MYQSRANSVTNSESTSACTTNSRSRPLVALEARSVLRPAWLGAEDHQYATCVGPQSGGTAASAAAARTG